ncbi:class I SAM-dependent methyltransferase [Halochromatium glycolicum]|jgi:O-methyltransferase involved in polyketide biosynthesis|uniref:class I SAM-dependent methyltransferase n=1 Tax=Halochromatium glycolicum TaxID=85075 RepID=UPI001909681D|nr:hypothetical protein [Halochromatium glycolicum]
MAAHPGGTVVELGCGLETQFQRIDDGRVHWLCVDVPQAIAVRERFLPPSERCRHLAMSALDPAWTDHLPASAPLFVTAQGQQQIQAVERSQKAPARRGQRRSAAERFREANPAVG